MKEIIAVVRLNKVNATKEALAQAGYPSLTCFRVLGRGKNPIDLSLINAILEEGKLPVSNVGEQISESSRLIPKRLFTIIAKDENVEKIIECIMDVNSTGHAGDGKIFVLPVGETYRIRNGETQTD